ncbi:MAG: hypothetical protein AAF394_08115 [Planctomycetota bacterium]
MDTSIRNLHTRFVLPALALLLTMPSSPIALSQQSDRGQRESMKSAQPAGTDKPSAKQASAKPKLTGRLPRYFSAVVSPEQRSEIYRIQKDYAAQMKALQEQLAALEADEMEKMEAVLSKTQLQQVGAMREKAKERVAARRVAASTKPKSASSEKVAETANPKDKS